MVSLVCEQDMTKLEGDETGWRNLETMKCYIQFRNERKSKIFQLDCSQYYIMEKVK